ncbi:hypothetical protein DH2020_028809 [Rehmannia glutinosa]|uniref:Glutathione peroxidase n=1 Tax=Rehmannia glutinosa TaxID=99300 RepID=A0ABR0VR80_REHGL
MASQSNLPQSIHEFTVKDAKGNDVNLGIYKGKVLLIVNVASQCMFNRHLPQDWRYWRSPAISLAHKSLAPLKKFRILFALALKRSIVEVNGPNTAPIYKYMKSVKGSLFGDNIKWNFSKFLVDKEGQIVDRYAPTTSPLSIEKDIKKLLGKA